MLIVDSRYLLYILQLFFFFFNSSYFYLIQLNKGKECDVQNTYWLLKSPRSYPTPLAWTSLGSQLKIYLLQIGICNPLTLGEFPSYIDKWFFSPHRIFNYDFSLITIQLLVYSKIYLSTTSCWSLLNAILQVPSKCLLGLKILFFFKFLLENS